MMMDDPVEITPLRHVSDRPSPMGAERREPTEVERQRLSIHHILAPFDGSPVASCTLPFLAALARPFSARITLLRVLEDPSDGAEAPSIDALDWEMARAQARANLEQLERTLVEQGCNASVEVVQGRPAEQIAHFARHEAVDLIVLASHGAGGLHGWSRASTVQEVADITHASVLIVPAARFVSAPCARTDFRKILVPLDCSQRAECILPAATELE
jgi:nucleotide-binding universal stress UspA family protein